MDSEFNIKKKIQIILKYVTVNLNQILILVAI